MAKSGMVLNGRELLEQEVQALEPGELALAFIQTNIEIQRETRESQNAAWERKYGSPAPWVK